MMSSFDRSICRACVGLLVVMALCVGGVAFGHHHEHDERGADHHCVACHGQQTVVIWGSVTFDGAPIAPTDEWLQIVEPSDGVAFASELTPPLRGPPVR